MDVYLNNSCKKIKISSISTLLDVITQLEKDLEPNHIVTEIKLNDRLLESNWYHNAKNIYLLDEDKLEVTSEHTNILARETLISSRKQYHQILNGFIATADMFRIDDEVKANHNFAQNIDNLQWYLKVLEDATTLLGKNLREITYKNRPFANLISELSGKMEEIINTQKDKDWILLADLIEYELIPNLKELLIIYELLGLN